MLERIKPVTVLVNEMLDHLPKSAWSSETTTFLDLAIGGGQFVAEIERRLRANGHNDENIRKRVFGFEENQFLIDVSVNMNKLVGQYIKITYEHLFNLGNNMKFDYVVGNPPYQNKEENADGALWLKFVNQGINVLKPNGKLVFITPTSWVGKQTNTKKADWSAFTDNHVELYKPLSDQEKRQHFGDVGSSFGYYVLSHGKGQTNIVFEDGSTTTYQLTAGEPLPNSITKLGFSIHQKIAKTPKFLFESNFKFHSQVLKNKGLVSDVKSKEFPYTTYYSHNLIRYADSRMDIFKDQKVMIPNVGTLTNAWQDNNCNLTEDVRFHKVADSKQGDQLLAILKSSLYKYIGINYRSGRNLGMAINFLPELDLSKSWTEDKIFAQFGLTKEEQEYVRNNA